jgi:hypothetical protein
MKQTMRNKLKYIAALTLLALVSCLNPEDLMTENAQTGGLVDPTTTALNYVVGNPGPYEMEFFIKQGPVKTEEIRFYKSFVTTQKWVEEIEGEDVEMDSTLFSNEILDRTIAITETENHFISTTYTFTELIAGLSVAGYNSPVAPLSNDDGTYTIGDKWVFRIEVALSDGRVLQQGYTVSASVSTRFAGKYKVVDATYYRLGVLTSDETDWGPSNIVTIASVDAITYEQVGYWGPFETTSLFFQIDPNDLTIYYPAEWDGVAQSGNGQPLITCATNPADMTFSNCGTSDIAIQDDVEGKDRLIMSYGYYTAGSGPREFYQVLEKIVE